MLRARATRILTALAGLRGRLVLLILLAIGPLVAAAVWQAEGQVHGQIAAARDRAAGMAKLVSDEHEALIARARTVLGVLAHVPALRERRAGECHTFLKEVADQATWQSALWVIGADGRVLCGSLAPEFDLNLGDRAYFKRAVATREFVVSDYIKTRLRGHSALIAALPVLDAAGQVEFVVSVTLELSGFARPIQALDTGREAALLVDGNGAALVWHTPQATAAERDGLIGRNLRGEPLVTAMLAGREGRLEANGPDGVERIWAVMPAEGTNAVLAVGLPKADLAAWATLDLERSLLLIGALALLAICGAWLGGELFVMRSVRALAEAARRVGAGDLSARASLPRSAGELRLVASAVNDMAERVARREGELKETTELLRATLENMDQGLMMIDAGSNVQICNRRAQELLDLPPAMMAAKPDFELVRRYQLDRAEFAKSDEGFVRWVASSGIAEAHQTYERERPDGTVLEIRTTPLPAGGVVRTYTDLTARKRAEQALHGKEAFLRSVLNGSGDCIKVLDLHGKLVFMNDSGQCALEIDDFAYCQGRDFTSLFPDESRAAVEAAIARAASGEEGRLTAFCPTAKGTPKWWDILITPVVALDGRPEHLVAISRDVTERTLVANALEAAKLQAERADQAKSDFLASMSHEIRTPLNGVIGINDLLRRDASLNPAQRKLVELAGGAGRQLLDLVNDILHWSKIEEGRVELESTPFDLKSLIDDCVGLMADQASRKGLLVRVQMQPGAPRFVVGDPTRLRQVLLNLLGNAVKFTSAGEISLLVNPVGGGLRFAVSDTGIGIPREKQHLLFERFSQVDASTTRRFGGTGLGLAICKGLVEAMGGEVSLLSEEGCGSTFHFDLSLPVAAELPDIGAAPADGDGSPARCLRILLAEDVALNQIVAKALLASEGHEVDVVENGEEAVEAARRGGYDLILLDIQMPVMDGYAAAGAIRAIEAERGGRIPILALTANAFGEAVRRCLAVGMDGHVAKPFERRALLAEIARVTRAHPPGCSSPAAPPTVLFREGAVADDAILSRMEQEFGREGLTGFANVFEAQLGEELASLAAAPGDRDLLAKVAHKLVSSAGMMGLMELSDLSRRILEAGDGVELETLHGRVRQAAAQAVDALHMRFPGRPRIHLAEAA